MANQEEDERIVEQLLNRSKFAAPESLVTEERLNFCAGNWKRAGHQTKNEAEQKKIASELFEKIKPGPKKK